MSSKHWEVQLTSALGYADEIEFLAGVNVDRNEILNFVDNRLGRKWGVKNAARVFSIATGGYDGEVKLNTVKTPPSKLFVERGVKVPGAEAPVTNLYHLMQAMTWVAQSQESIDLQDSMINDLFPLVESGYLS